MDAPAGEWVLLADVGGTNVRFALADTGAPMPLLGDTVRRRRVADFERFGDAARDYLAMLPQRPRRGVLAVAGPVTGDSVRMTNHPWVLSRAPLLDELGLERLRIVNDFAAMSHCVPLLGARDVQPLGAAPAAREHASGRRTYAIVGPGTGLGVGGLVVEHGRYVALETEGGHVGFAPGDEVEFEVLRRLMPTFGRVSAERVLCGSGLVNLHAALHPHMRPIATPEAITSGAEHDAACRTTIERFCAMLGSFAGDFALAFGAWDGVYLAGGLTPKLLAWLQAGEFRRRFEAKGRYERVLANVPTIAVLHEDAGLLGAAALAVLDDGRALLARGGCP
ncbi:glucokinase [Dokdonella sp.]|uniref:glucokinase n=1 Tax=Dokdonella sp. TaxID=2291710 RepID=UPI002F3F2029